MPVYQFSLLIQAAGTFLLFLLFLLLYKKARRRAFLDWIASWAFLLIGLALTYAIPRAAEVRSFVFLLHIALLAHVAFLLLGVRHFRDERAGRGPMELLWVVPVIAIAWWTALESDKVTGQSPPMMLVLAAAYVTAAVSFAIMPGSAAGRGLLSISFLVWGVEHAITGAAYLRFRDPATMPESLQYVGFASMLLEMMIAVGIIILLFETSQSQLSQEMQRLVESDQQLREMGIRDPLTGLYNRHHFNDVIRRETANVRRYGISLSVLLADIDRFKEINDVKGHAVGDDVLKFVAAYLTSCVRESDFVFRWGGDEFLVLLPRTDEGSAAQKAEELAQRLPHIPGTEGVLPALSVGWATHRMDAEFPMTLAQADARMYEMKLRGKKEREERERHLLRPPS
ncbi:MAG TPA: GGDEF domain-containing protein [Thermoanaerobaculia bacterium]|nr:GGDEF domain-containing protein [Thermoanaerobaculia bacterium]